MASKPAMDGKPEEQARGQAKAKSQSDNPPTTTKNKPNQKTT